MGHLVVAAHGPHAVALQEDDRSGVAHPLVEAIRVDELRRVERVFVEDRDAEDPGAVGHRHTMFARRRRRQGTISLDGNHAGLPYGS